MQSRFKLVALLAAAFLLPVYSAQALSEEDTPEQIEAEITRTCATQYKGIDPQDCRRHEYDAKATLDNFTSIPGGVADKCMAGNMDTGYAGMLKCIQGGMASYNTPPSNKEAGVALSHYVGAAQKHFIVIRDTNKVYLTTLQQDMDAGNRSQSRIDGAALTDKVREAQGKIAALRYFTPLTDKQSVQFEAVSNAMTSFADAVVAMDEDMALSARTGIPSDARMDKEAKDIAVASQKFRNTVMAAYKALGYAANKIDPDMLTLKD